MSGQQAYRGVQKLLHWAIALCVLSLIPIGLVIAGYQKEMVEMVDGALGKGWFNRIYDLHKSLGVLVLALMILRVAAKLVYRTPPHDPPLAPFQRIASAAVHGLLYMMLIVTPLLGWAGVSSYRAPVPVFGLFEMPPLLSKNRELSEQILEIHGLFGLMIAGLIAVHIGAALYHSVILKDGVLRRMLP